MTSPPRAALTIDAGTAAGLSRAGGPAVQLARRREAVAAALRGVWAPFWVSRILVWATGCLGVALLGTDGGAVRMFDPTRISESFGRLGNLLAAPAVRWDSIWYLQIAQHGYSTARETAFYPLYPLLVRAGSWLTGSLTAAGISISLACLVVGLVIVHRLTELELGPGAARATVVLMAFAPMSLFDSAVYTESLFLALSAGTFYAARRGRWAIAGLLGCLAAMTRVEGCLLLAPVALMFFYGPRTDEPPAVRVGRWQPRYRFTPAVLWSLLIPAGAGAFSAYLALRGFGATSTLHAQEAFSAHRIVLPVVGLWDGVVASWHQLKLALSGVAPTTYASQELLQIGFVIIAALALVGVFRRLPPAYGAYVAIGLLVPLASPTIGDPLRAFDRYASQLFPLFMWAGAWTTERRGTRVVVCVSSVMLVFFSLQFATWHWVGSPQL